MEKDQKIRTLFIIDFIRSLQAGTEKQLSNIINGLDSNKFDMYLYTLTDSDWIQNEGSHRLKCSISIKEVFNFSNPVTYLNLAKMVMSIRALRPDIVHTFFPMSNIVGVIAARMAGVKCIVSSRRDYGDWMSPLKLILTKFSDRFIDGVITNSHRVKELTILRERIPSNKVNIIYNGVDFSLFDYKGINTSPVKKSLGIPDCHKVVGAVANLRPMKHLHTLIMSAGKILETRDDVHFLLIGSGPSEEQLYGLVQSLGIESHVHFLGSKENVLKYVSIFDVGVNCSSMEGLSNAIIEYMGMGVPCVVSNAGGNPDLIENAVNGYTFELDDHKELARLILEILNNEKIRNTFVGESKKKIECMTLENIISQFENYYLELVGKVVECQVDAAEG